MDIKKYKKEQSKLKPYEKISQKLAASIHEMKAPMNMRAKLKGLKEHKEMMAKKMNWSKIAKENRPPKRKIKGIRNVDKEIFG